MGIKEVLQEFRDTPLKNLKNFLEDFDDKSLRILLKRTYAVEPEEDLVEQIYLLRKKEIRDEREAEKEKEKEKEKEEIFNTKKEVRKLSNLEPKDLKKNLLKYSKEEIRKIYEKLFEGDVPNKDETVFSYVLSNFLVLKPDFDFYEQINIDFLNEFLEKFKVDEIRKFAKKRYPTFVFSQTTKIKLIEKIESLRKTELNEKKLSNTEINLLRKVTRGVEKTSEIDWNAYHQEYRLLPPLNISLDSVPEAVQRGGPFAATGENIDEVRLPKDSTRLESSSEKDHGPIFEKKTQKKKKTELDIDIEKLRSSSGSSGYSLGELKEFAISYDLAVTGKKADIAKRILGFLRSEGYDISE